MGPWFNVSSERLLAISVGQPGTQTHILCSDPKHSVHESYALPTELYPLEKPQSAFLNNHYKTNAHQTEV